MQSENGLFLQSNPRCLIKAFHFNSITPVCTEASDTH
uniref:Uncharacterized protein n=1 Tax=Anguilla anguilla TaxID=7936 RepID=A0A0E9SW55_ANGAN